MNDRIDDAMLSLMDREQLRQAVLRWSVRATRAEQELESTERHLRQAEDRVNSLRAEVRGLRNGLPPVTLEALAAAWEAAEAPTDDAPIRAGDVIIYRHDGGHWAVREVEPHEHDDDDWSCTVRILSRAPKRREPWQDLAALLAEWNYSNRASQASLEQFLYERGVRVTGGDES